MSWTFGRGRASFGRGRAATRRHPLALLLALAVLLVTPAACGGGDDAADEATTPSASPPTVSAGLTPPGETLDIGDSATVVFAPDPMHESRLRLTVTGLSKGKVSDLEQFSLDAETKQSGVYYVRATARNVGRGDLSGQLLTLFGRVTEELVVRPVEFGSPFPPCNYQPFPQKFTTGHKTSVCMVMLAPDHGTITEVQWRTPDEEPIAWAQG